jgi:uncharacterized protein (DUF488 family)
VKLYTIGFARKSAERFFALLGEAGVKRLVDVRLRPGGQLAGFAKQNDLRFFLDRLIGADYLHLPQLAPEDALLDAYRKDHHAERYAAGFEALMQARDIPASLDKRAFTEHAPCVLLCSEPEPDHCHRRLVAERLARAWSGVEVIHLT